MTWWPSKSVLTLRQQVNERWPGRSRVSDGVVGDTSHAARKSDHNPDLSSSPPGVVRAIDVTAALDSLTPGAMQTLVDQLCGLALSDRRLSYIIYRRTLYSALNGWRGRPYTGANPHDHHAHFSFTQFGDHDGTPFRVPILEGD